MKKIIVGIVIVGLLLIGMICASYVNALTITNEDDTTPPSVWFSKPKKGILYPLFKPVIIGSTQIWPHAADCESGLNYLELYIDNELKANFSSVPKSWLWDEHTPLKFRHKLKLVAYDNAGNMASDEIIVWKFF